jgi:hypothetical protein
VRKLIAVRLTAFCLFLFTSIFAVSQEPEVFISRGSIPEELLRPKRGEAPHYPVDIVIGELGQGTASDSAFSFANYICSGFLSGKMDSNALVSVNSAVRESLLSSLEIINPVSFRIGGGREEADGAVSFLVRYIGKDQGITGEMYIRYVTRETPGPDEQVRITGNWTFEELLLEEAKDRDVELQESKNLYSFYPYERFY